MFKAIKKFFKAIIHIFSRIRYWLDYWDIKPGKEMVGLMLALCCAAVLFFLPSYNPPYNMTAEKFAKLCERHDFEMTDRTDEYYYVNCVVEDTHDDYTFRYYSGTDECYTKFYHARETVRTRKLGGRERYVYNSKFDLVTFTEPGRHTTIYRNGSELLIVSGPSSDAETLNAILKKCRIPNV